MPLCQSTGRSGILPVFRVTNGQRTAMSGETDVPTVASTNSFRLLRGLIGLLRLMAAIASTVFVVAIIQIAPIAYLVPSLTYAVACLALSEIALVLLAIEKNTREAAAESRESTKVDVS